MKSFKHLGVVLVLLTCTSCSSDKKETLTEDQVEPTNESPVVSVVTGKYKIKSGTVHFETSAGDLKGKKIVYFDDYGAKERVETYEDDGTLKGYNTSDGKTRYYIDLEKKSAWIVDQNGGRGWEMEFHSWSEIQQQGNHNNDFKRVDNITLVGKDCEAYEYGGITVFAGWQRLTLYQKQKPNILITAVKLEENVAHAVDVFSVPAGFELKEMPKYN